MNINTDSIASSSPDPLANSVDDSFHRIGSSPSKSTGKRSFASSPLKQVLGARSVPKPAPAKKTPARRKSTPRKAKQTSEVTGESEAAEVQEHELILHTPSKKGKGEADQESPWRIRVTVSRENSDSPSKTRRNTPKAEMQTRTRSRTVKVPLKDADDSADAPQKQPRTKKARNSDSWAERMKEVEAEETGMGKRKRGRASSGVEAGRSKRRQSGFVRDLRDECEEVERREIVRESELENDRFTRSITSSNTKRPKDSRSDMSSQSTNDKAKHPQSSNAKLVNSRESHRKEAKMDDPLDPLLFAHGSDIEDYSNYAENSNVVEEEFMTTIDPAMATRLSHDGLRSDELEHEIVDDDAGAAGGAAADYGLYEDTVALDRSLAESEGFSMVSIESLRSQREQAEREAREAEERKSLKRSNSTQESPAKVQSKNSELSSSVKKARVAQHQTPADSKSHLFGAFGDSTQRKLRSGLHMGELLARGDRQLSRATSTDEDFVRPPTRRGQMNMQQDSFARLPTPPESVDLADTSASLNVDQSTSHASNNHQDYDAMSWRATTQLNSSLHGAHEYDDMSWRQTTPQKSILHEPLEQLTNTARAEQQYQDDRRRVSQQIEDANTSQVIVINSSALEPSKDAEYYSEDDEFLHHADRDVDMLDVDDVPAPDPIFGSDIWQAEADRSLEDSLESQRDRHVSLSQKANSQQQPKQHNIPSITSQDPTPDFRDLFPAEDSGPQRSKIPRTWRRVSGDNSFLYSDETAQSEEDSPPKKQAFKSPGAPFQPSAPSVLMRWAARKQVGSPVSSIAEKTPSTTKKTPRKSILLSSPDRRASSPPKEVRFAEEDNTYAESMLAQESSINSSSLQSQGDDSNIKSSSIDDSSIESNDDSALTTLLVNTSANGLSAHTSIFDTSDARQLKGELRTTQYTGNESTFDSSDAKQLKHELRDSEKSNETSGIFSRMLSWLYPPVPSPTYGTFSEASDISSDTSDEVVPSENLIWTRNHYLLLNHFYRLALSPKAPGPSTRSGKLPPTFYLPLSSEYSTFIGHVLTSVPRCPSGHSPNGKSRRSLSVPCGPNCSALSEHQKSKTYEYTITQTDMRVVHVFCEDAKQRGVPLLGDPRVGVKIDQSKDGEVWPKRDQDGKVMRIKEDWDIELVVERVFSLWVGARMEEEEAQLLQSS